MKASKRYSPLLVDHYQDLEGQISRTANPHVIADILFIARTGSLTSNDRRYIS